MTAIMLNPTAPTHRLRTKDYDSADPWTDYVISVVDERGGVHSGWKMRNVHWPARVREEHSETAYTTDQALALSPEGATLLSNQRHGAFAMNQRERKIL
jgi:hypothetical protein